MNSKTKHWIAVMILAALAAAATAAAQDSPAPSDYFKEGVTARAFGLGGAFVGIADDIGAVYWNPAGLGLLSGTTFSTTRSTKDILDLTTTTQTLTFAAPVYRGVAGFNLVYSSLGGGIETAYDAGTGRLVPIGVYDEDDTSISAGYGWELNKDLYVGATLKRVKLKLSRFSSSGFGFDIGALMLLKNNIRAGLVLQNIGDMDIGSDSVPFNIRLGGSIVPASIPKLTIAMSFDSNYLEDSFMSIGAEYRFEENLAARIGSSDGNFAAGLGVRFDSFQLDYSFNRDDDLGDESRLTLGYYVESRAPKPEKKKVEKAVPPPADKKADKKDQKPKEEVKKETEEAPAGEEKEPRDRKTREDKKEEVKTDKKETNEQKKEVKEEKPEGIGRKASITEAGTPGAGPIEKSVHEPAAGELGIEGVGAPAQGKKTGLPSFDELLGESSYETEPAEEDQQQDKRTGEGMFKLSN